MYYDDDEEINKICYYCCRDLKNQYFVQIYLKPLFYAGFIFIFMIVLPFYVKMYFLGKYPKAVLPWVRFIDVIRIGICYTAVTLFYRYLDRLIKDVNWWILSLKTDFNKTFKNDCKTVKYFKTTVEFFKTYNDLLDELFDQTERAKNGSASIVVTGLVTIICGILYHLITKGKI